MIIIFYFYHFITFATKDSWMEEKNRRTFLKLLAASIFALFAIVWNKLTHSHINQLELKVSIFPLNKNRQVSFYGNYIVINQDDITTVLSSHCSHLGCSINQSANGRLICPCHGSEYDLNGNVVKGPAYKGLEKIPAEITEDGLFIKIGDKNGR